MYPNRTMCEVLHEMRNCYETRNFASLMGMIEEVQSMGNRMEGRLSDTNDVENMLEKRDILHAELKTLRAEKKKLRAELGKSREEDY